MFLKPFMQPKLTLCLLFMSLIVLLLGLLSPLAASAAQSFQDFVPPQKITKDAPLPKKQYIPIKAQHLANPKILWINHELFKAYGIDLPQALTPELEKEILNIFALGIKSPDDSAQDFVNDKVVLFTDRYRSARQGSGRAASFLSKIPVQLKGLGRTPLASGKVYTSQELQIQKKDVEDHTNGKTSLDEAIRESIWGELNHYNLPFGGNRVFLIIDRGTKSSYPHHEIHHDSIIVREDPVRPAHFAALLQTNESNTEVLDLPNHLVPEKEDTLLKLQASLQISKGTRNVKIPILNYIEKVARQFARAYHGINYYHGASLMDNFELSAKFLDYATQTAQHNRGKIFTLDFMDASGEMTGIQSELVYQFLKELKLRLPPDVFLPTINEAAEYFDLTYNHYIDIEYLRLLGIPDEYCEDALKIQDVFDFIQVLRHFATLNPIEYSSKSPPLDNSTQYDFRKIVSALHYQPEAFETMAHSPQDLVQFFAMRKAFKVLIQYAYQRAQDESIPPFHFKKYLIRSVAIRNRVPQGIHRYELFQNIRKLEDNLEDLRFVNDHSSIQKEISSYIQNTITNNRLDEADVMYQKLKSSLRPKVTTNRCMSLLVK